MKRLFILMAAAVAALFAVSCAVEVVDLNENVNVQGNMKEVTITASVDPETKTSYDADGTFSWHKGDQISVFCNDKKFYTFTATETGATATFTGLLPDGITPRNDYAFFPASAGHRREGNDYYFHLEDTKDLSESESADLPMGAIMSDGVYKFSHMTGAALFTFNNVPDGVDKVEVSFSSSVRLSGEWGTYTKTTDNLKYWTISAYSATEGTTEGTFVRTVKVKDNTAKVYLPYPVGGSLWSGLKVSVKMTTPKGKTVELLNTKTKQSIAITERAHVIQCSPVTLPDYVDLDALDWDNPSVVTSAISKDQTSFIQWTEIKAFADAKYLYVQLTAPKETWDSDHIRYYLGNESSTIEEDWLWNGEFYTYESNRVEVTDYNFELKYNGKDVIVTTNAEGAENVVWAMAFPRNAHEITATSGKVSIGFFSDKNWTDKGAIPYVWTKKMEVTLP